MTDDTAVNAAKALELLYVADSLGSGAAFEADEIDVLVRHLNFVASSFIREHDRADRAEARLADAWEAAIHHVEPMLSKADKRAAMADNPYRSEATA